MINHIDAYIEYLKLRRNLSENTLDAYRRDMKQFFTHLEQRGVNDAADMTNADIVSYIMNLRNHGRAGSTVNRKTASVRAYADFLCDTGVISRENNPAEGVKPPKIEKQDIDYLSMDEINALLELPDDSVRGIRDRAILEILYGTGIRVTELTELRMQDVNFRIGFITCNGEYGKARIIPLGAPCREALLRYLELSRPKLVESRLNSLRNASDKQEALKKILKHEEITKIEDEEVFLFMNYHGEKLTRQGVWKIVRRYADESGIKNRLTPQILRNSFAAHMIKNGADLKSVQELMGYEDVTTVQIYLNITKNRIKEVFDRTHPRA